MGITRRRFVASAASAGLMLHLAPLMAAETAGTSQVGEMVDETAWQAIREFLFQDRAIDEGNPIAMISAPYRAQNGADVSVQIAPKTPQTEAGYIKKHYLVVDENPSPVVGQFALSPKNGSAAISTRIRVDKYTHVRVISEDHNNRLHMHKTYVKSSGGCSAPPVSDSEMAALNLGKTRLIEEKADNGLSKIYVSILHPNHSGLQRDIVTNLTIPPHYVTDVVVTNTAGEKVFSVKGDISFSENPSFEFYYKPKAEDVLLAQVTDSQGRTYDSTKLTLART